MVRKSVALRIALATAVIVLAAATALAADGNKSGFKTINAGRMTVATNGGTRVHSAPDPDQNLSVIFSNLGSDGSVYNCCTGWTISAVGSIIGGQNWIGEAFTPTTSATATKLKVAVGYVTGTNGVTIGIYKDNNGVPGGVLKKWNKKNVLPAFGSCCALVVGKNASVPLTGGTQYWVVVKTSSQTPDTWDAFNLSNSGTGTLANNTGSGWVNLGDNQQGAFAVLGN
jgi:hypothetical protein